MNSDLNNEREIIVKKEGSEFIYFLNQVIIVFFCMWVSFPYFNYMTGNYFGVFIIGIWFLTTDLRWLTKKLSIDLVLIIVFFLSFLPYILTGSFRFGILNPMSIFGTIFLFFTGIFISHYYIYYKKDFAVAGRIAFFSIIFFTAGAVQTYFGLQDYPLASRQLAHGVDEYKDLYQPLGIGGYGFSFGSVFIILASSYFLYGKSPKINVIVKGLLIVSISILTITVFETSYATALIMIAAGLFLLFIIKNAFLITVTLTSLFLLLSVGENIIGEFFLFLGGILENNEILQTKAYEFADSFLGIGEAEQAATRLELYEASFLTFMKNPFFGIYGPAGIQGKVGGHAGWIDMMAYYGLFTAIPMFLGIYFNTKKHLSFFKKSPYFKFLLIISTLFLLLGFIKATITIYHIGITMFVIVPSMPFLNSAFKGFSDDKNSGFLK